MMFFIWLKEGAVDAVEQLIQNGVLKRIKVDDDEMTGKKRVIFYGNVFNPTVIFPAIPPEFVEEITLKQHSIYKGFRPEGMYRHKGATMHIRIEMKYGGVQNPDTMYQEISISAPSIEIFKEIYTLVRQSKLNPDENWNPPDTPIAEPASASEGKFE